MYKPLAGCVCLAIPCVRPLWWETQPGYVQNNHQAYTDRYVETQVVIGWI